MMVLFVAAVFQLAACGGSDSPAEPDSDPTLGLRAESNLTSACYDWPTPDISLPDAVGYAMPMGAGERAIDFTLEDTSGAKYTLSGFLETRPVLIVFGAYT